MKNFAELPIAKEIEPNLSGDKIAIDNILNKEIVVQDYRVKPSRYAKDNNDKCLHLQIIVDGVQRVVFTGSSSLMETLERIEKSDFPFKTTIKKNYRRFDFT